MAFAIILLLGPGDQEIERARDLFDSILSHEPAARGADVFLVDDGNERIHELDDVLKRFARCHRLRNPLPGRRHHPHFKLTAGMIRALSHAARTGTYEFALKLDTDTLIINPFHDKLVRFFGDHPRVGMAGSYLRLPTGAERRGHVAWAGRIEDASRVGYLREALRQNPIGAPAALLRILKRRRILESARRQGYQDGYHVQGGGYAVSAAALRQFAERSTHRLELLFRDVLIGEDATVSLLVSWMGLELADFNAPGEVFGVWWLKPKLAPEVLSERFAIIHSVKSFEGQDEQELRKLFRDRRAAMAVAAAGSGNGRRPAQPLT